jgi:Gpi18-like mannosyltransferase
LKDEYLAYKSVLLFCLTPTAVFFSGAHVDTFLAMATFAAMLVLERSGLGLVSGLLLALCTSLHPSGLLHLGLVLHRSMKQVPTKAGAIPFIIFSTGHMRLSFLSLSE